MKVLLLSTALILFSFENCLSQSSQTWKSSFDGQFYNKITRTDSTIQTQVVLLDPQTGKKYYRLNQYLIVESILDSVYPTSQLLIVQNIDSKDFTFIPLRITQDNKLHTSLNFLTKLNSMEYKSVDNIKKELKQMTDDQVTNQQFLFKELAKTYDLFLPE